MNKPLQEGTKEKLPPSSEKSTVPARDDRLYHLAFDNSSQANIISIIHNGKIIAVNRAACILLCFNEEELLTKYREDIFDINESSFKKMLKQRTDEGQSTALVNVTPKNSSPLLCEITSAVFTGDNGIEKSITTIADMSESILKQKNIDAIREKKVADNILLAISKQIDIDKKNKKIVAKNILLAISKQIDIDVKNQKIVADNIALAIAKQKNIDVINAKAVADNIVLALSKQKKLDIKKEKIVADNIALAISNQNNIDVINAKAVADNIVLALSKQKKIDTKKEKIVADNIALAQSKQKTIDTNNEKKVADNIVLAELKQKKVDTKKEKIVADNIILAQTESDARLVENNELIKHIANSSYDVMWDWDITTGQINVSDGIEEVFGYRVQNNTVNFTDVSRCLLPEENDTVEKKLYETLASTDKSWNDAFMLKRHDGSVAYTTSRASIVRDKKGKAIRLVGAIRDVSRVQQLEKKLEEQVSMQEEHSEKFFLTAKITSDVIWDWNLLTDSLFMGEGYEELFGYTIKSNTGNLADWSNHLHPEDKVVVVKGLYEAIASSNTKWEHSYRFVRADGSIAKVFDRASIFRQADGKACRMIGAIQDITERKKTEREKEQVIKELLKSNADLKQFSYITSHNLRAPLSNIESILSVIDYSALDTDNAEMLKMLNISGKQLSKTIEDLTKILVIKNNVNAEIHTISLTKQFDQMNNIFSVGLNEAGAKVFSDFKEPHLDFNETYFESILINLFSNAIKYRSPGRSLIINASSEKDNNGNTIFRFSDNGSGIDINRHKDKIFGLYQRFHNTIEGQGLGLYIIKSQIEALNGTIEVESELDKGSTFIITFKNQSFEKIRE